MRIHRLIAAATLACAALQSHATVLTFDELKGDAEMPVYGGLNWSGWRFQSTAQDPYGAASGQTRVYDLSNENAFGSTAGFTFEGASFAGFATVYFQMFRHGELVASSGALGTGAAAVFLSSGYAGLVDRVTVVADLPQYFVMDDVIINSGVAAQVPEPGSVPLALGAMLGMALIVRRRSHHSR